MPETRETGFVPLTDVVHVPTAISLAVIGVVLTGAVGASVWAERRHPAEPDTKRSN